MGRDTKHLIDNLAPACVTSAEAVCDKIMWLPRETTTGLSRDENRFIKVFKDYISCSGHPDHPSVLERTTSAQRAIAEDTPAFRAKSFVREVTGTNLLSQILVRVLPTRIQFSFRHVILDRIQKTSRS